MSARLSPAGWRVGLSHAEAATCLGETLSETSLLLRAGISGVGLVDLIDADGRRVMACASPALPVDLGATERMVALASHVLGRVPPGAGADALATRRPPILLLCLPERFAEPARPFELNAPGRDFLAKFTAALPAGWASADIETFPLGRAAGATAMARAMQLAESRRDMVWGGVDSLLDWPSLEPLVRQDRLMTMENVDGLRPGEAAAFSRITAAARGQAWVAGLGLGREPHPGGHGGICLSEGFSQALTGATAPLRSAGERCGLWLMDTSHERHATRELQQVLARFGDVLGTPADVRMPFKELGDVGAASLPLLAALALAAWEQGTAGDDIALLAAGSEDGARGALLLETPGAHGAPQGEAR
jgi:hypothetical protein